MATHIIKRHDHDEVFDEKKVYASVYAAARNAQLSEVESERIAEKVMAGTNEWIADKPEVPSANIFWKITELITKENEQVAYQYHTHRDVS